MAICPYCFGEHSSVEELGLRMHKFSDRWFRADSDIGIPDADSF